MHIKTDKVNAKIGDIDILKDINIDVDNKEFVGIIGPNGSGKSTFLKCIYRTLKPHDGTIKLDEVNIDKLSIKETAKKNGCCISA
ncbi:ABC transporter ATP-binding protein [[Clostridium] dakarense]|uniref:ABC transporter ATP-binding protein n=1 Tax=Faecalimicrobium dakarense TaxID=1301100 RepID=UPI0004B97142|nr:ABC transporter ATP-binding protein [[Clostridium] dakarense]